MKWICRILGHSVIGFAALFLFNFFGGFFGLSVGLNLLSALTVGLLGIPGFALLLILQVL